MMDATLNRLINEQIDGQLNPGELELLNRLLSESDEARHEQAAMHKLDSLLATLPPQLPPLALHDQILNGIRLQPQNPFGLFRNRSINTITRLSYILIASLMLAIGLYVFNPDFSGLTDTDSRIGTTASVTDQRNVKPIDAFSFAIANLASEVRLHEVEDKLMVDLTMNARIPVEIELDMISGNREFTELALTEGWRGHLTEGNKSVFLHNMGQQRLTMQLSEPDTGASRNQKTRIKVSYFIRGNRVQQYLLVNPH